MAKLIPFKLKIYPEVGEVYTVTIAVPENIPVQIHLSSCAMEYVDDWIDNNLKNVDHWEIFGYPTIMRRLIDWLWNYEDGDITSFETAGYDKLRSTQEAADAISQLVSDDELQEIIESAIKDISE